MAFLPFLLFIAIIGVLVALAIFDFRHYILPDKLNALLAVLGIAFHGLQEGRWLPWPQMALGMAVGGGLLWCLRLIANKYYHDDALGLGDVKLMAAAGLVLGFPSILLTLSLGAVFGLLHGAIMGYAQKKKGKTVDWHRLNVPAGVGFCFGIGVMMILTYFPFIK